jgi:hypothetical protein
MGTRAVPREFSDYFRSLYAEAHEIMVERQAGYGPGNIEALGPYGVMSRLAFDKCSRVMNEMNGEIVSGKADVNYEWFTEGVRDALMDIANDAMITIALGEGEWSKVSRTPEELEAEGWEPIDDTIEADHDDGSFTYVEEEEVV